MKVYTDKESRKIYFKKPYFEVFTQKEQHEPARKK